MDTDISIVQLIIMAAIIFQIIGVIKAILNRAVGHGLCCLFIPLYGLPYLIFAKQRKFVEIDLE